jgi:hypothetical protein
MSEDFIQRIAYQRVAHTIKFKFPDFCPRCGKYVYINKINLVAQPENGQFEIEELNDNPIQICIKCPACNKFFLTDYEHSEWFNNCNKQDKSSNPPTRIYPNEFIIPDIAVSERLLAISKYFHEIYQQAFVAEQNGLMQIAGCGYRKSLEFLIKDYCIFRCPDHSDKIKKDFLMSCIDEYIDNPRIKKCAKGATYLGNDETHYNKIWPSKDISDLKALIKLTATWIESELEADGYEKYFFKKTD